MTDTGALKDQHLKECYLQQDERQVSASLLRRQEANVLMEVSSVASPGVDFC
jgi:hypothetical protein